MVALAGIWLIVATTAGCGGNGYNNSNSNSGGPTAPTPTSGSGSSGTTANLVITINGMNGNQSFSPNPATIRVGQTVAWRNADSTTHNATANGDVFRTANLAPGATSATITVTTTGSFDYLCTIHPSMVGTLVVTQ
jgi:plastocyanin